MKKVKAMKETESTATQNSPSKTNEKHISIVKPASVKTLGSIRNNCLPTTGT